MMNTRTTCRAALITLCFVATHAIAQQQNLPLYVADQVIVSFQPGTPGAAIADAHRQAGATPARTLGAIGAVIVQVPSGGVPAAIAAYERNPNVRYAEPNYLRPLIIPNEGQDPPWPFGLGIDYFEEQYGLHNMGQPFFYDAWTGQPGALSGAVDADIDAPEAWELSTGSASVTVAVLDSGIDCNHADLVGKCIENINLGPSTTTDDLLGHGTHVAGIIGATGNNGIGVAGVGWSTTLASIKVCYEEYDFLFGLIGLCDAAASAAGMIHAADLGYQVINMSYAGPTGSQVEADAAAYAWNNGVVLVAAAANSYTTTAMYPAAFPQVIGVAATDWFDNLASFSSFGGWVSIAAPGVNVFNTLPHDACGIPQSDPDGCYGWLSGTSMASPMVAGAAAVVWSYLGAGASNAQVRTALEGNADSTGALGQNMRAWTQHGRLNLHGALTNTSTPPASGSAAHIGDLDGSWMNQGSSWTARVTVTVHNDSHNPVGGATVQGVWSGGFTGSGSCSTGGTGQCMIQGGPIAKKTGSATFTVTGILGADYQSASNHDPDGESTGTSIVVSK